MRDEDRSDLDLRTATSEEINEVMTQGALDALKAHKQAGNSVVIWEDDRVVLVPPEDIPAPEEAEAVKARG